MLKAQLFYAMVMMSREIEKKLNIVQNVVKSTLVAMAVQLVQRAQHHVIKSCHRALHLVQPCRATIAGNTTVIRQLPVTDETKKSFRRRATVFWTGWSGCGY